MPVELTVTVEGDRFVEAVLEDDSDGSVIGALERTVQAELGRQTQVRVDRFAEETDRDLEYRPELTVSVDR